MTLYARGVDFDHVCTYVLVELYQNIPHSTYSPGWNREISLPTHTYIHTETLPPLLYRKILPFFRVLAMKMSTSWVGTGTIGISVEFYTYLKKNFRKKNTSKKPSHPLTWRFLGASYDSLCPGSRLWPCLYLRPRGALSEYTSLDLLPGLEQGDLITNTYIHTYRNVTAVII